MRLLLALALALSSGLALGAPDEEILGKNENYPVCQVREVEKNQKCLVGTLSHMDEVVPARHFGSVATFWTLQTG